jgi:PGF-CTERM protein
MQFPLLENDFTLPLTVRSMRNKSIPCIISAALLLTALIAPLSSAESGDETITVNHVVLVDTPPHPEWEWNYSYQVEVNDLQMDVNYTAVILYKQTGDDEWRADWWWDDIESDGDQFDQPLMLQRGCYFINASLYEKEDLNSDAENATVLAAADLDFVVGTGTCVDGVYSEEVEVTQDNPGPQDGADDDAGDLPGFGLILSITAALGAALIATRRE